MSHLASKDERDLIDCYFESEIIYICIIIYIYIYILIVVLKVGLKVKTPFVFYVR